MGFYLKRLVVALAIFLLAGCAVQQQELPPVVIAARPAAPKVDYSELEVVLDKVFDDDRLIDAEALAVNADHLNAQVALLAITGPDVSPELFTTSDEKLAYWYNARAAWSLKLFLDANCPEEITSQFSTRRFPLDGQLMSLRTIDLVLEADPDFRVVVSAPQRVAEPRQAARYGLPGHRYSHAGCRAVHAVPGRPRAVGAGR